MLMDGQHIAVVGMLFRVLLTMVHSYEKHCPTCDLFLFCNTIGFCIPVIPKENALVVKVPVYVENVDAIRKEQRQILLEQYRAD